MKDSPTTAIVVYHGVLVDEAEIFRFVLSRIPEFRTVTVGTARGQVMGPGGVQTAAATLDEIGEPEVIVVPGGIGCHCQTEIANWLRSASPTWLLASSTGSALLAAAGLLHEATAATHWLAGPLLERYGARASHQQVVVDGPIITCSGCPSAFRAALVVAEAYGGPDLVARIRAEAANARNGSAAPQHRGFWAWFRTAVLRQPDVPPPPLAPLDEIDVLDLGLVTPPDDGRSGQR